MAGWPSGGPETGVGGNGRQNPSGVSARRVAPSHPLRGGAPPQPDGFWLLEEVSRQALVDGAVERFLG